MIMTVKCSWIPPLLPEHPHLLSLFFYFDSFGLFNEWQMRSSFMIFSLIFEKWTKHAIFQHIRGRNRSQHGLHGDVFWSRLSFRDFLASVCFIVTRAQITHFNTFKQAHVIRGRERNAAVFSVFILLQRLENTENLQQFPPQTLLGWDMEGDIVQWHWNVLSWGQRGCVMSPSGEWWKAMQILIHTHTPTGTYTWHCVYCNLRIFFVR